MKRLAFLFSGQGSQHEGMGLDFIESNPNARQRYESAREILGWSPSEFSHPEKKENLAVTLYTQPCIYTLSCVILEILADNNIKPSLVAGHSAGEFAALTAAGVWNFETGLQVIAERARLMYENANPGAMSAVLGLAPETVQSICEEWSPGIVCAANFNSPKQTVITGEPEAVQGVAAVLKEKGAKRVLPLKVSGAFHSPLMKEAQVKFSEFFANISINDPQIPWVSNNSGKIVTEAVVVREHIIKQFCEPVRWTDCMASIANESEAVVEVGPGEVLKGLASACCPDLSCWATDSVTGLTNILENLA